MHLDGRISVVTGAGAGIGRAIASRFSNEGAKVVVAEIDVSAGQETVDLIESQGGTAVFRHTDTSVPESIEAMINWAAAEFSGIDIVVNNAGIGGVGAFEAMPMSLVRQLFETNSIGTMAMCRAFIPQMRERGSGMIVNVTSTVALGAFPLAAAYSATKHAIEGFTASLAHELAYFGVQVKLVEPGYAPTTRFGANAIIPVTDLLPGRYADFAQPILAAFASPALTTRESDVAQAVWTAVHDGTGQLRFPAGADAVALAEGR